MTTRYLLLTLFALFTPAIGWNVRSANASEFIPLGGIRDDEGGFARLPSSVSDDGQVVAGHEFATRWMAATGWVDFADSGRGYGGEILSGDGSIIVGTSNKKATIWDENGTPQSLGGAKSSAIAVSSNGEIVVGQAEFNGVEQAFRWTEEDGMVGLGRLLPDERYSTSHAVSDDGSVIVGDVYAGSNLSTQRRTAFRWTAETGMVDLGFNPGSQPMSVSSDGGTIAGGWSGEDSTQAFRRTEDEGLVGLGWLPGTGQVHSEVRGISGDGSIMVGRSGLRASGLLGGFVWTEENGMEFIQQVLTDRFGLGESLDGWILRNAQSISKNGQFIVGDALNPEGLEEGWLVRLDRPIDRPFILHGDYTNDGLLDVLDIDAQAVAINDANPNLALFDENDDGVVDLADRKIWIADHAQTWAGDANFDGEFGTADLVAVFIEGKYETGTAATWAQGDWNGDLKFGTADLALAFQGGGYELGPRVVAAPVPEPSSITWVVILLGSLAARRRPSTKLV